MADSLPLSKSLSPSEEVEEEEEDYQETYQHYTQLATALQRVEFVFHGSLYCYSNYYGFLEHVVGTMVAQKYFKARPTDILLATLPKSGTTWLKALLFTTINRHSDVNSQQALESYNPHELIPYLEFQIYTSNHHQVPELSKLPAPRLFSTHIPFHALPTSIADSGCRIVYLCRNPKDNFISYWHYFNRYVAKFNLEPWPLEDAVDAFCKGHSTSGPYWDHVLGYWKAHLERPHKVLFMKYEELKEDPVAQLKRLAEFLECPFSEVEAKEGVIDGLLRLCAFDKLSNLEVNRTGVTEFGEKAFDNNAFFRRGVVGDWVNHLTPKMVDRLDKVTEQEFRGCGLMF